jgi:hypothetical protein
MANRTRRTTFGFGIAALLLPLVAADARIPRSPTPQKVSICGWVQNPTPGNWWITDRFGQWVMGSQGGEQVPGMDAIPDLTGKQWVKTNGYYGHGCGCMRATVDRKAMRIVQIHAFTQKPLAVCRADPKLPSPED